MKSSWRQTKNNRPVRSPFPSHEASFRTPCSSMIFSTGEVMAMMKAMMMTNSYHYFGIQRVKRASLTEREALLITEPTAFYLSTFSRNRFYSNFFCRLFNRLHRSWNRKNFLNQFFRTLWYRFYRRFFRLRLLENQLLGRQFLYPRLFRWQSLLRHWFLCRQLFRQQSLLRQ